jgi:N-carbamoyl-L-amino-acid hydrolase
VPEVCQKARGKCDVRVTQLLYDPPLEFPKAIRARVTEAAQRLGLPVMDLPSPAGHDSRYLHYSCPTGMVFIPCKGGLSHNEAESITADDAAAGARVLADVAFALADEA